MTPETYLAYLATLTVFFLAPPGPSQILMISHSLRHGLGRSRATIAGDLSANALQMTAAAFGLAALIGTSQAALTVVKWAGVAYLVYVGLRMWHAPASAVRAPAAADGAEPRLLRRLYRQAFVTSATNPQAVVFFAALFPQFIDPATGIGPQLALLGATYLVLDGLLLLLWGGFARRLMALLGGGARYLNRLSGGLMIGAAALLALRQVDVRDS
ncbi:LysE family translocator [Rhodosalinus sp. K401]|uniref:LysE family translocator n=1 Tax=Rhodosalinus sp. K401 TaxID=3239195 RepID=UPI0035232103